MNRSNSILRLVMTAMLVAIGLLIPMVSPVSVPIGPTTVTLGSHVAVFLAMFLSPVTAVAVALGTTVGFFLRFPVYVALRALSHVVWAFFGALWLRKFPETLYKPLPSILFCLVVAVGHGLLEAFVMLPFFFSGSLSDMIQNGGVFYGIFGIVGGVTVIHSCMDYAISILVWRPVRKVRGIREIAAVK